MESTFSLQKARKQLGIAYLGATRHSAKMNYSYKAKVETYCIYLAPYNMSGYQVCPNGIHCKDLCLNGAGRNKGDIIAHGFEHSIINVSRIKKTKLFYENRELFMNIMIAEIKKAMNHAKKNGLGFAVRINGTSDLSPELFVNKDGKNILELFPTVQFYDYTKVNTRLKLQGKYKNYDLTLSYNGYNWDVCEEYLNNGGKVAVVFENELPKYYKGYKVINANDYDMRYMDEPGCIMGLHFHRTAKNYENGKYTRPNTPFVVLEGNIDCHYEF